MREVLKSYLEYICGKDNVEVDALLSEKTNFKIGGPAKFFVTVPNKAVLLRLVSALKFIEEDFFIIGGGYNILAGDYGFDGVVVKLGFSEILDNGPFLYADAGARLGDVLNFAKERTLSGLEFAVGIPGTVGGAVFMNAGAYGGQLSDVLVCADVLVDGAVVNMNATELRLKYRTSIFQKRKDWIILGAYFYLSSGNHDDIEAKQNELFQKRLASQPYYEASAGSTFRRPRPTFYVGTTIRDLGLQGLVIGGAQISEKHAGFIINKGGATARDVIKVVNTIKREVYKKFGVRLRLENVRLGRFTKSLPLHPSKAPAGS